MAVTTPTAFMMGIADKPNIPAPVVDSNEEPEGDKPDGEPEGNTSQPLAGDQPQTLADQLAAEFERRGSGSTSTQTNGEGDEGDQSTAAGGEETVVTEETTEVEGGEGGGGSGGTSPTTTTTPSTTPEVPTSIAPPTFSMDEYAEQIYGRKMTPQETQNLFAWQDQFSKLEGAQLDAIQGIIDGKPVAPVVPVEPEVDPNVDPYIQQHLDQALNPLKEQLGQVTQFVQSESQRQSQENAIRTQAQIEAGTQEFTDAFQLTPEQVHDLETRVVQSGIFPGMYNSMQQDARAAMNTALQQVFWATPEYRDIAIKRQLEDTQSQEQADVTRKRKASALSGSGGQVSRETPPPTTKQGRQAAMASELAEHMNGSGTQT